MTQDYLAALSEMEANPELTEVMAARTRKIKWDRELRTTERRKKKPQFNRGIHPKSCVPTIRKNELLCRLYFCKLKVSAWI